MSKSLPGVLLPQLCCFRFAHCALDSFVLLFCTFCFLLQFWLFVHLSFHSERFAFNSFLLSCCTFCLRFTFDFVSHFLLSFLTFWLSFRTFAFVLHVLLLFLTFCFRFVGWCLPWGSGAPAARLLPLEQARGHPGSPPNGHRMVIEWSPNGHRKFPEYFLNCALGALCGTRRNTWGTWRSTPGIRCLVM